MRNLFSTARIREPLPIMRLRLPLCWFNRHVPRRNRAKWDGAHFTSTCRYCNADIRRREQGRWEKDWLESSEEQ